MNTVFFYDLDHHDLDYFVFHVDDRGHHHGHTMEILLLMMVEEIWFFFHRMVIFHHVDLLEEMIFLVEIPAYLFPMEAIFLEILACLFLEILAYLFLVEIFHHDLPLVENDVLLTNHDSSYHHVTQSHHEDHLC